MISNISISSSIPSILSRISFCSVNFSVYLHEKMKKFPHYEKFTLQKDIRESIDGILDEIEMFEITKVASHLYAADRSGLFGAIEIGVFVHGRISQIVSKPDLSYQSSF